MHGALRRLASGVQAARVGLAYGALAEGWFAVVLAHRSGRLEGELLPSLLAMSIVSLGLYVFGVSMNDVLDRRHDRAFALERNGRWFVSVQWLTLLAIGSLLAALGAAAHFGRPGTIIAGVTAAGIVAYNALAKFIPAFGFVSLGALGALHMLVPDARPEPILPFWWSMTVTAITAGVVHRLRQKRPQASLRGMLVATGLWALWSALLLGWVAADADPLAGFTHPVAALVAGAALLVCAALAGALLRRNTVGAARLANRFARLATLVQALAPAAWFLGLGERNAALLAVGAALALACGDLLVRATLHLARPLDYQP